VKDLRGGVSCLSSAKLSASSVALEEALVTFVVGSVKVSRIAPLPKEIREICDWKLEYLQIQLRVSPFISFPMQKYV
jgi:hypothetical protein